VAGFYLNASIGSVANGDMGDFEARMTFPLFVGGERQLQRKWVGNGTLPAGMGDQYTDDQLELLCVAEVRSSVARQAEVFDTCSTFGLGCFTPPHYLSKAYRCPDLKLSLCMYRPDTDWL
jgi:hypothetical protein